MRFKRGIATRIQRFFLGFALLMSAVFSVLILGYSWVIEDNIFNRLVEREAAFIADQYAKTGMVVAPRPAFMTLYDSWDQMPDPIPRQHRADPNRIEFDDAVDGTIHTRQVDLGPTTAVLAANVSGYEVSRDYLPTVSLWLLLGIALTCALAAWVSSLVAKSAVEPLRRLTDAVAEVGQRDMKPGFARDYPDDEVGFLAETIEASITHLQTVLQRETDFTRDVSHELRTPASVLTLLSNQLETDSDMTPENRKLLQNTVVELNQTISTLLALAREENMDIRETALLPLLEESVIHHFQLSRNDSFDLQIEVPSPVKVRCNAHLATILFNNLLTNAMRYASEPGLRISADDGHLIFENAADGDAPRASGGLGLGLNLAKRVCNRFHWTMRVERTESVFRVRIEFPGG
ncbi:Histidine kinase [Sulfidibacter corallicola]|uniref:histidine kinase n=1 Tax=Sulfidibacter corallicola TaxID=2818388 RepID=A0A8A4U0R4_SULCO|nr:HAMP domain-containing sensor histidine kinase [Sulfidibacter corallicola]QTD52335.1 HAMP domain-containing histidine kinase [Sulfidibacter corallicola]